MVEMSNQWFETIHLNFALKIPSNEILSISDALMSIELNTIRVSIIDIRASETYSNRRINRTSTFVMIGDNTTTTYLIVTDLTSEMLKVEHA